MRNARKSYPPPGRWYICPLLACDARFTLFEVREESGATKNDSEINHSTAIRAIYSTTRSLPMYS